MKTGNRVIGIAVFLICVLILVSSVPVVTATTEEFTDSIILVVGNSNTMYSTTLLWLFGWKFMVRKQLTIQANGENGEHLNAFVLPPKIGMYLGHEDIRIQMAQVRGLCFWGKKSLLFESQPPRVFALCKANYILIDYE
jgi:hypothetical protein